LGSEDYTSFARTYGRGTVVRVGHASPRTPIGLGEKKGGKEDEGGGESVLSLLYLFPRRRGHSAQSGFRKIRAKKGGTREERSDLICKFDAQVKKNLSVI